MDKKAQIKISIIVFLALIGIFSGFVLAGSFNPNDPRPVGYELLNNKEVVHIWNNVDDYYFDKSSGIQMTNDFENYWSKNIFCLGYYAGQEWNVIKCSDELYNFRKEIETDDNTFVNATMWKDFYYNPNNATEYKFRLGINYYLGLNDENLTITIYGKNIGDRDIPVPIGFAWKITDIDVPMSDNGKSQPYGDSIEINRTRYNLEEFNETLIFKNMSRVIQNITIDPITGEDIYNGQIIDSYPKIRFQDWTKFLKLDWNKNLDYTVKMYGDGNQSNFYVALLINAGSFDVGESKATKLYWIDALGDYVDTFDISAKSGDSRGVTTDGSNIWILDVVDKEVYKYDMSMNYVSSFDTSSYGSANNGLANNGTHIFVDEAILGNVYIYKVDGTHERTVSVDANSGDSYGMTCDVTNCWLIDHVDAEMDKYTIALVYISTKDISAYESITTGVTNYGDFLYTHDYTDKEVYIWNKADMSYVDSFDTSDHGSFQRGIGMDANYFYVVSSNTDDELYRREGPGAGGDSTPPTFSNVYVNETRAGQTINFSAKWSDSGDGLTPNGYYIFSTNNTGGWVNESIVVFTTTPDWANVTKTLNDTIGKMVSYQWYANDTAGNWGGTGIYNLTVIDNSPTSTLVAPPDGSQQRTPLNFTYTPTDDLGFTNSSLYLNITNYSKYEVGVLLPTTVSSEMNGLMYVHYEDSGDADTRPDLFFMYQEFADAACLHYYQSNASNSSGFEAGVPLYCMDEGSFGRGVFDLELMDINNDSVIDLVAGNDGDFVTIMYGNVSKDPPFDNPVNLTTPNGNEADYVVMGHSSNQTLMDIFNVGEEVCAGGTCLYQFKANGSELIDGYDNYRELGAIPDSPDTNQLVGGYFNDDEFIDLVVSHTHLGVYSNFSIYLSDSGNPGDYDNPIPLVDVIDIGSRTYLDTLLSTDENHTNNPTEINGDGIADLVFTTFDIDDLWGAVYIVLSNDSETDFFNDKLMIGNITLIGTTGQQTYMGHIKQIDINNDSVLDIYAVNYNRNFGTQQVWLWIGNASEEDYFNNGTLLDVVLENKTAGVIIGNPISDFRYDMIGVRQQVIGGGGNFDDYAYFYQGQDWISVEGNATDIVNNTINNITESFDTPGTYLWNIMVTDSTGKSSFASANRTVEIIFEQLYERKITQIASLNQMIDGTGGFLRKLFNNFALNNVVDSISDFFRDIFDSFNLDNVVERVGSFFRKVVDTFNINNVVERVGNFLGKITDTFNINNVVMRIGSSVRGVPEPLTINDVTDGKANFFRDAVDTFKLNTMVESFKVWLAHITDNFTLNSVVEKVGDFFRGIPDTFSLNQVTERVGGYFRDAVDTFALNNVVERVGSYFRDIVDNFTLNNIVDGITSFFRDLPDTFTLNNVVDRTLNIITGVSGDYVKMTIGSAVNTIQKIANFVRGLPDFFGISNVVERVVDFIRGLIDTLGINNLIDKLQSMFRDIVDVFNINDVTERIGSFVRKALDNFSLNNVVERIGSFIRGIPDTFALNQVTEKIGSVIRDIIDNFTLNNVTARVGSFIRDLTEPFSITILTERVADFFRDAIDSFTLDNIIYKWRSVERNIFQFFQMILNIFRDPSYIAWNWITSANTTIQGNVYEEVRVQWDDYDNWVSFPASPQNWINVTKTYTLPADCGNVIVKIGGEDRTSSILVSNVGCVYTVINNHTITPGSSSNITINYTTNPITSSEGTWTALYKQIYVNTSWANTLTVNNPSIHDYTDIFTNITTDLNAVPSTINISDSVPTIFAHNFSNLNGNVNWSLPSLNSLDLGYIFYTNYKTQNVTLNKTNYTEVSGGKTYEVYNATIEANSTRPIYNVYTYFDFSDTNIMSNQLFKCSSALTGCTTDISNRADVVWSDLDGDGTYDYVAFFVLNLTQNQSFQVWNDQGFPVEIVTLSEILNKPVYVFDNINWRTTITMYNPNPLATTKVYKYEFPLGSVDIKLDDVSKNLQYDTFGNLAPYVTIVDKDQIGAFPDSVYLAPLETKIFVLTYRTESVTLDTSTYFPTHFEVDEPALISQVLRIKNQAETDVTDVEYRIPLDYGEDLIVCRGEYEKGCPDNEDTAEYKNVTMDTQEEVKGDYTLEVASLDSGESRMITLSYYVPTAVITDVQRGRRSVVGNLTVYKLITFESQARFTMADVRYKEKEIKCEQVQDVFKCRPSSGLCDIPIGYSCPLTLKIGTLGMSEQSKIYIWYMDEIPDPDAKTWIQDLWHSGRIIYLEEGSFLWYLLKWIATEDSDGRYFVTVGRLIITAVGLVLLFVMLFFIVRGRRIIKRKGVKNEI